MSKTDFPKPWRLAQSDPGGNFWVFDANDRKLFHISSDDVWGPTVLEFGTDAENDVLMDMLFDMFEKDNA